MVPFRTTRHVHLSSRTYIRPPFVPSQINSTDWPHPIAASERITDRKSTFQAHASRLGTPAALPDLLAHIQTLPRIKRATHCMYAYRAGGAAGQSDGGEGGSGDRLARLLALCGPGCADAVVVVSRWYGGVPLGADRWRRISAVAREALGRGGFLGTPEGSPHGKGKVSKRKR